MSSILLWLGLPLSVACGTRDARPVAPTEQRASLTSTQAAPSEVSPLAEQAVAGVDAAELRVLLAEHWELDMRRAGAGASSFGDHRYDAVFPRGDAKSIADYRKAYHDLLGRARTLDARRLSARDKVTLAMFVATLEREVVTEVCREHEWIVSAADNSFVRLSRWFSADGLPVKTPDDAENALLLLEQAARAIDDQITNLRTGAAQGWVASAESIRRAVEQLDTALAQDVESWALLQPVQVERPDWTDETTTRFRHKYRVLVNEQVKPATLRLRDVLRDELMPKARTGKNEGLVGLPQGKACYAAYIAQTLDAPRDPAELHQLGLTQLALSEREIGALGKKLFGTKDLQATLKRLRTDPKLYFSSSAELLTTAEQALARAQSAVPASFATVPKAPCVVAEVPAVHAPYASLAYYDGPHYDGSKPGRYYVNTSNPELRTRYDFEALSFHESVPGHHLETASAQELGAIPLFRKLSSSTAYGEGWGLYAERLADEQHLYSSDLDRLGMWNFDAWRSARLVVDTGLHAFGWTRAQAEAFMREHTALTYLNIANEVDRYLSAPAQALAYKLGQLEIFALRAQAQKALGDRFDLRTFHDAVLSNGGVTLPILRAHIEQWIANQTSS
jgi:uncharacterized protein (DUF885 family)